MAQTNGGQTQQNGMSSNNGGISNNGGKGNGTISTAPASHYVIKSTGQAYHGLILEWMGRLVTTQTGTYEGIFSQTLTTARTKPLRGFESSQSVGNKPPGTLDPPIIIDDPEVPGEEEYQGGGGM
jgi:hypothetical protein